MTLALIYGHWISDREIDTNETKMLRMHRLESERSCKPTGEKIMYVVHHHRRHHTLLLIHVVVFQFLPDLALATTKYTKRRERK
jgi:hypothetical protein